MNNIKITQIDYRYVLVDKYKELGLNELDLAVLLVVDNILREQQILVTADLLAIKMTNDVKELDKELVSLEKRNFLEYKTVGNTILTSLEPTFTRLIDSLTKDCVDNSTLKMSKKKKDEFQIVYEALEKAFGRTLSAIEIDRAHEWINSDFSSKAILDALSECQAKATHPTIRQIDKILVRQLSHQDREKEGYSAVNEKYNKDIEKTIEIASYDWINEK